MATRRKKIVIAAISMLILLSMVGYSNADATEETALALKYCGGATAMIVTEIGIEGKEDNEDFRCFAKTDIKKPDLMSEEEFCSYVMPLAFEKYKDGKCYFIPLVNCDPATTSSTFAYYSLCVRILESKDIFINQEAACKQWGGELLKVPARNLRKWIYKNHKGTFWTSLEEADKESLVLYTFDDITNPDIQPGSLIMTLKETKRENVTKTDQGMTVTRTVVTGDMHGAICTKSGTLTIAGRKDKLELYSAIHPNTYKGPNGAKIFVSTGVYVPRIDTGKRVRVPSYLNDYGHIDYDFYKDICTLVPDVGELQSQIGIPHADMKNELVSAVKNGKWGMLGTTGMRTDYSKACVLKPRLTYGFQGFFGTTALTIDDGLWAPNEPNKYCSDMPDTALIFTEAGLVARPPFVRTHVFCYVGKQPVYGGLERRERCDQNADYDGDKNKCKCKIGHKDRGQREKGTECDECKITKPPHIDLVYDQKNLGKEEAGDVIKSTATLKKHTGFRFHIKANAGKDGWAGFSYAGYDMHEQFNDHKHLYPENQNVQWSEALLNYHLRTEVFADMQGTPILMLITDGNAELWKASQNNEVFGMSQAGKNPQSLSFLLELREKRQDAKFMFVNVVKGSNANAVAKMKKDWIAAGIARSEDEIVAVTDIKSLDQSLVFHIIQLYCT